MEYKTEFTFLLPEKLTAALDIDEDTLFETYFDDSRSELSMRANSKMNSATAI